MSVLDPEQLTGRTRSHVLELPELHCTLHAQAARAFLALRAGAAAAGIDLEVASSFRDFERQLAIWNDKFQGRRALLDRHGRPMDRARLSAAETVDAILHWSALPGASRHHWGTEIDVIDRSALGPRRTAQLVPAEYAAGGLFARLDGWLAQHAESFGFHRPYDCDRGGVQPEPWHLSYAPVSGAALPALTVEVLAQALRGAELAGAEVVLPMLAQLHARYVLAVALPGALALAAPRAHADPDRLSPGARPS